MLPPSDVMPRPREMLLSVPSCVHHVVGCRLNANPAMMPALAACVGLLANAAEAEQIHTLLVKSGIAQSVSGIYTSTSLLHVYSWLSRLGDVRKVFDGKPKRTVVSWNMLLDGLVREGDLDASWEVFVEIPGRNLFSWNTLIAGFTRHWCDQEIVELFIEMMMVYGFMPNEITMVGFVSIVRNVGLLRLGRRAHSYVIRQEFSLDSALGVALINKYTKCGSMSAAYQCFSSVTRKNVEHWASVIGGFATHGHPEMALKLFTELRQLGIKPNGVTFVSILNACSHGGLVDEGFKYFDLMRNMGIRPSIQHHGCLVDLLGRARFLEDAFKLASSLPEDLGIVTWSALLAACQSHGNVEMAEIAAQKVVEAEPSHGNSSYVLLSNTYAHARQWKDLKRMRSQMDEHRVVKKPGLSWIKVNGTMHSFITTDMSHIERNIFIGCWKT